MVTSRDWRSEEDIMVYFMEGLDASYIHPPMEYREAGGVFIFFCFMIPEEPIMVLLCLGKCRVRAFPHFSSNRNYSNAEGKFIFSVSNALCSGSTGGK